MSNVAKFLIVVNLLLAGVFVGSAANFLGQKDFVQEKLEGQREEWKTKYTAAKTDLDALTSKNRELSAENSKLKTDASTFEQKAKDSDAHATTLSNQLNRQGESLSRAVTALELQNAQLKAQQELNTTLQGERAALKESRDTEHTARVAAEAMVANVGRQLEDEVGARKAAESNVAGSNRRIQELEAEVAAIKVKFPNLESGGVQPAVTPGKVLAADNAMGIVVISLGEEDGLKRGFEYIVSRGNQYVATIKITDVQAKKSTGSVVKGMQKSPIQANDTVMNP